AAKTIPASARLSAAESRLEILSSIIDDLQSRLSAEKDPAKRQPVPEKLKKAKGDHLLLAKAARAARQEIEQGPRQKNESTAPTPAPSSAELEKILGVVERENETLRERNEGLVKSEAELRSEIVSLNARITGLLDGTELKAAKKDAADSQANAKRAQQNVVRLESLCGLRGIDPAKAIASIHSLGISRRDELKARLENETDPLRRGEIANELRELDAAQKK